MSESVTEADPTTEGQTEEPKVDSSSTEEPKQQDQQQVDESTKDADATPEPKAPESYEFKNPEGLPEDVDSDVTEAYANAARELDLSQDQAQAFYEKTISSIYDRAMKAQEAQVDEWTKAAKEDSEFGGSDFEKNRGTALKAVEQYGTDGLKELLQAPGGLGDHPEVIRFLFRVGSAISEDRYAGPGGNPKGEAQDRAASRAERMYPTHAKN